MQLISPTLANLCNWFFPDITDTKEAKVVDEKIVEPKEDKTEEKVEEVQQEEEQEEEETKRDVGGANLPVFPQSQQLPQESYYFYSPQEVRILCSPVICSDLFTWNDTHFIIVKGTT